MARGTGGSRRPALAAVLLALPFTALPADPDLAACRSLGDPTARLACYDALADAGATRGTPTPAPATPTATDLFGRDGSTAAAELATAAGLGELDELSAAVASVTRATDGRLLLELDNGQAWLQSDTRRATVNPGVEVRIRRAAFGSYLLSTTNSDRRSALRVRRIR